VSAVAPTADNPLIEGLERLPVHPTTLVIFGATGDLSHRKLLPALYNLAHEGALAGKYRHPAVAPYLRRLQRQFPLIESLL